MKSHALFLIIDSLVFVLPRGVDLPLTVQNVFGMFKHEYGDTVELVAFYCIGETASQLL